MGSADDLHLIECFTRISPDTINYEVTVMAQGKILEEEVSTRG